MTKLLIDRLKEYRTGLSPEQCPSFDASFPEVQKWIAFNQGRKNVIMNQLSTHYTPKEFNENWRNRGFQDDWIEYWNITDRSVQISGDLALRENPPGDDKRFASMADFYHVFRQIEEQLSSSSEEQAVATSLMQSLKRSIISGGILTSTRISYEPNTLDARIIHGYGAKKIPQHTIEIEAIVPEYMFGVPIKQIYSTPEGLSFLQALFNTEEDGPLIASRLTNFYGCTHEQFQIITPLLFHRNSDITRAGNRKAPCSILKNGDPGVCIWAMPTNCRHKAYGCTSV